MLFDELNEKSLMELRELAREKHVPNIKKMRKGELVAILSGQQEAPAAKKRGRKPGTKVTSKESDSQEIFVPAVEKTESEPSSSKRIPAVQDDTSKPSKVTPVAPKQESIANSSEKDRKTEPEAEKPSKKQPAANTKRRGRPPKAKKPAEAEAPAQEELRPVETKVTPAEEVPEQKDTPVSESNPLEGAAPAEQESQQAVQSPQTQDGERRDTGYSPRYVNRDPNRYGSKPRYNNNSYVPRNQQRQNGYQPRDNGYSNRRYSAPSNGAPVQDDRGARPTRQTPPPMQTPNYNQYSNQEQGIMEPYYNAEYGTSNPAVPRMLETEDCPHVAGVLEVMPEGYGFLRVNNYYSGPRDIYLSITQIRRFSLRCGDYVEGRARPHREGDKFDALMYIDRVNEMHPDENARRVCFEDLVPIYPDERYTLEVSGQKNELSVRLIDLIAPIGKGQRAMIVSQPKAGKTTLLKQIAAGITANYPEAHLMVLLIDERPEEVTDMKRCIQGEVIYSTFDELPEHHTRIAEMVQERAMRLVEQGQDVVILLDSLTRLTRAYNLVIPPTGRTLSGGMDPGALHKPKRFFGAARNIEGGGSLTVIATALVETGSRMDDIVYEEFKGTGNMEIHLDRKLSEKRIFPAIDIYKSGTRRDDLLLSPKELEGVYMLRKFMAGGASTDVTEQIIPMLEKTTSNEEFIAKIKDWIKIYEHKGYSIPSNQNRYGQ